MSDKIEIQGKTVEAAVSEALLQLGARRDEVEIKVLEEPKSGFMGFLGGRAARVMVRKKRSRGRGGSGRDHRVEDDSYKAHNLGGRGRSRGGSRRRPSGGSSGDQSGGRNDNRQASREPNREGGREEKTGTRRGSRGRGGRGRNQAAGGQSQQRDQKQDQPRGQRQDQQQDKRRNQRPDQERGQRRDQRPDREQGQRRDQRPDQERGQRRNQRQGQQRDQRQDQQQSQQRDQQQDKPAVRGSRNRRGMPRDNRGPEVQSQPARNAREDSAPREETPIRPLRQEPVNAPETQEVPIVQVTPPVSAEAKPIEKKEEVAVTKPNKPRRGFGGLGARIKERKQEAKAAAAAEEAKANPPAETETPAAVERPVASYDSPAPSRPAPERPRREQRAPSYASARSGEEVVLSGIKGVKYAKSIGPVTDENLDDALTELTDGMLARAGFPCRCETHPGEYRQIKVTTDDASAGMLIGRHGQAIDAVEHLVERMASNAIDARARINLDINNYRQSREESLAERVAEASATISESGRPFHMEPMSARERRLVHMEAANLGGLRTFTMDGSGGKHVVIAQGDEAADGAEDMENPDA